MNRDSGELAQAQTCCENGGQVTSSSLLVFLSFLCSPSFLCSLYEVGGITSWLHFWGIYVLLRSGVSHVLWGTKKKFIWILYWRAGVGWFELLWDRCTLLIFKQPIVYVIYRENTYIQMGMEGGSRCTYLCVCLQRLQRKGIKPEK